MTTKEGKECKRNGGLVRMSEADILAETTDTNPNHNVLLMLKRNLRSL